MSLFAMNVSKVYFRCHKLCLYMNNGLTLPPYKGCMMPLQQTTFENSVTIGKTAHDEHFLLLPHFVQLYSILILIFKEILHIFAKMISKSSAADLLYVGKGKCHFQHLLSD